MTSLANTGTPLTVGAILARHPEIEFDLVEHVETLPFMPQAHRQFEAFKASFAADDDDPATLWRLHGPALRSMTRTLAAYRRIDWETGDAAPGTALIDKQSLRDRPDDFATEMPEDASRWYRDTSGTTGRPVRIWVSPQRLVSDLYMNANMAAWMHDVTLDDPRHRTHCLLLFDNKGVAARIWAPPDGALPSLQYPYDERDPTSLARVCELVAFLRPAVISTKPNVLASILERTGGELPEPLRSPSLVVSGGADLPPDLRLRVRDAFAAPVADCYGMSEVGNIAIGCSAGEGLHLNSQSVIAEVLEEDGVLRSTGTGELVVTGLRNPAMPLLRYRTGDLATVTDRPCSCGRRGRRILSLSGRRIENFVFADGTECSPTIAHILFRYYPIREFRLTQMGTDRLLLEVEWDESSSGTPSEAEIAETVAETFGRRAAVEVLSTRFSYADKFQRFRRVA